jgi:hypothetical protein
MGIFDAFTPEGLMRAMGVDPQQLLAEYARWKAEFDGMKNGVQLATSHFNNRLITLEAKVDVLLSQQTDLIQLLRLHTEVKLNGHVKPVESQHANPSEQ